MEIVLGFIFLCSKITADGDCSHEIKRCLLLGRKDMTNLDSTLKCRDITLLTKVQEENNRMGKTRYLFKKIRDIKGIFHAKKGAKKGQK